MIASLFYFAQTETHATQPGYFAPVALTLLIIGGLMWLVAVVLGYGRARSMEGAAKWFARSAVCLLIYHLQFLMLGVIGVIEFSRNKSDFGMMLNFGAFFNLFIVLAALCAILGFMKLKAERTETPTAVSD